MTTVRHLLRDDLLCCFLPPTAPPRATTLERAKLPVGQLGTQVGDGSVDEDFPSETAGELLPFPSGTVHISCTNTPRTE